MNHVIFVGFITVSNGYKLSAFANVVTKQQLFIAKVVNDIVFFPFFRWILTAHPDTITQSA